MTTIRTLAEQLGLSITTVSRALDGYTDVAAATRERVRAHAHAINYQPNAAARSLRRQKASTVAVALPAGSDHAALSGLFKVLLDTGVALSAAGFDLLMQPTSTQEAELASLRRLVEGRKADAIILVRTHVEDPRVAFLDASGVPFVTHGRTAKAARHAYIDGDGQQGFRDATMDLVALGHRRIGHISGPPQFMFSHVRRAGWWAAMRAADLAADLETAVAAPNEDEGRRAAHLLLSGRPSPTALLCATDMIAIGAMAAARELGMIPGRDIAIIGHDGLSVGAFTDPPLSTMELEAADVGALLAKMLLERIGGRDPRDLQLILPVRQLRRATHAPPRDGRGEFETKTVIGKTRRRTR